jgi:hypothetical protein
LKIIGGFETGSIGVGSGSGISVGFSVNFFLEISGSGISVGFSVNFFLEISGSETGNG